MRYLFILQGLYFNFYLGFSFWTLILLLCIALFIESTIENKKTKLGFYFILSLLDSLLFQYFLKTEIFLDTAIVIDNIKLTSNEESRGVLYQYFSLLELLRVLIFPTLVLISYFFDQTKRIKIKGIILIPIILLLVVVSTPKIPLMNLISGGVKYFLFEPHYQSSEIKPPSIKLQSSKDYLSKMNIMIILMESFNGTYVGESFKGKEVTPNFNKLIKQHFSIDHYFSNSVQTVKGQFAFFCGRTPLLKGKASYLLDGKKLSCLPERLKRKGYRTIFYQSMKDLEFDNTNEFFKSISFDEVLSPKELGVSDQAYQKNSINWGLRDDVSFSLFFDHVQKSKKSFSVISTITHHFPFKIVEEFSFLINKPKNAQENFLNSLHLSDYFLGKIIEQYKSSEFSKNSILIVTADHSFPSGRNGNIFQEKGATEDNFKAPFVIIAPPEIENALSESGVNVASHVDIMPTLLDLFGTKEEYVGDGVSFFSKRKNPIPLIQPYDGQWIKVIDYPQKYSWNDRRQKFLIGTVDNDQQKYREDNLENYPQIKKFISKILGQEKFIKKNFRMD